MNKREIEEINKALEKCCKDLSEVLKSEVTYDPVRVEHEIEPLGGYGQLTTIICTRFFAVEIRPFKKRKFGA